MTPLRLSLLATSLLALAPTARAQFVLHAESGDFFGPVRGMDDAAITPDGRYAIVRENAYTTETRVHDLVTGDLVVRLQSDSAGGLSGVCEDAVACTDERAVVLGSSMLIVDLTNLAGNPLLASHLVGFRPRDLAITPDGTLVVVRGGSSSPGLIGGQFVFDLASGSMLATAPGEPSPVNSPVHSFDVDSVVASDDHAVCTSLVTTAFGPMTRVTVWDLHPQGGGPPVVAFETAPGAFSDQIGAPHDVAITPDGAFAAVRSELSVGLYRLSGAQSGQDWLSRLWGAPGPFGNSALDSIEVTNEVVTTISRWSNGGVGAQLDIFDIAGNQRVDRIPGDPHDLTITPNAERLVVRTSSGVFLYDLTFLPAGIGFPPLDSATVFSTLTSFGAGLDTVAATDACAITLSVDGLHTAVGFWRIDGASLVQLAAPMMPDQPIDVAISPDQSLAVISGRTRAQVFDMNTFELLLDFDVAFPGGVPWCDGVVLNDDSAVAFGYTGPQSGWISVIDLFSQPTSYCVGAANSAGTGAEIYATGSASVAENDLELRSIGTPPNRVGAFVYGSSTINVPFGDGVNCVGGQSFRFPFVATDAAGVARQSVDYSGAPQAGGAVTVGSTWNFQFKYRDPGGPGGSGFNASDGVSILFGS